MVSVVIGVIYYGQELNQDGVININGALFIFLTNMTFQNVFAVINVSKLINHSPLAWWILVFWRVRRYSFINF